MKTRRNIVITLTILAGLSIISIPVIHAFAPAMYVSLLNSSGAIINGATAGASVFAPHEYVSALDSTGHIINTFGGGGSVTSITPGTGLTSSPNPITGAGTISLSIPVSNANGGTGVSSAPLVQTKCQTSATNGAITANQVTIVPLSLMVPATITATGGMTYGIGTADGANPSDVGIYYCSGFSTSGTLVNDIGAQLISGTGTRFSLWMTNARCTGAGTPGSLCTGAGTGTYPTLATYPSASQNVLPGYYLMAFTSAASTLTYTSCTGVTDLGWFGTSTSGVSASGILPATFTCPALSMNSGRGAFLGLN